MNEQDKDIETVRKNEVFAHEMAADVQEFPLTEEEITRLEAEADIKRGVAPKIVVPKFYSIAICTAVNHVINVRIFYIEAEAMKFLKQVRIMGVRYQFDFLQDADEEKEFLDFARAEPTIGEVLIGTNPKDLVQEEGEPAPVAGFGPVSQEGVILTQGGLEEGMTVTGEGIPEGAKVTSTGKNPTA